MNPQNSKRGTTKAPGKKIKTAKDVPTVADKPLEKLQPEQAAKLRWADDGGDMAPRSIDPDLAPPTEPVSHLGGHDEYWPGAQNDERDL